MFVCVRICVYVCMCTHVYVCVYMYVCMCMYVYVCACMYVCVCMYVYIYLFMYVLCIYVCMYVYNGSWPIHFSIPLLTGFRIQTQSCPSANLILTSLNADVKNEWSCTFTL